MKPLYNYRTTLILVTVIYKVEGFSPKSPVSPVFQHDNADYTPLQMEVLSLTHTATSDYTPLQMYRLSLTFSCPGTGGAVVKIGHSNLRPGSKELSPTIADTDAIA